MKKENRKYFRYSVIILLIVGGYPLASIFQYNPKILAEVTQVTSSGYTKNAYIENLGGNRFRFSTKLGMQNIWNGFNYVPYIYDNISNSVQFANSKITFYDWYAVLEQEDEVRIDDMRWVVQSYTNKWRELDLWNHYFYEPVFNRDSMVFIQAYDDGSSFMNVSYTISNYEGVKVTIDFISGIDAELRFVWQLSGMQGDIIENMSTRTFSFSDVIISCNDTDSNVDFTYDWVVANKKLDLFIGSYNVLVGESIFIDPTFSGKQETDALDFYISDIAGSPGASIGADYAYAGYYSGLYNRTAFVAFETGITDEITSIGNSTFTIYIISDSYDEADERVAVGIYNASDSDGYWNETEADASEQACFDQVWYWSDTGAIDPDTGNKSYVADTMLEQWKDIHNADVTGRTAVAIRLCAGDNADWNTTDYMYFAESTESTANQRPTLTFDYVLAGEPTTTTTTTTTTTPSGNASHPLGEWKLRTINPFHLFQEGFFFLAANIWILIPTMIGFFAVFILVKKFK